MLLDKHEKRYKSFLKYETELNKIEEQLRKLPLKPLPEPIQVGWIVYYTIREDIQKRKDFPFINEAFACTYGRAYNIIKNSNDVRLIRKGITEYRKKGEIVSLKPGCSSISKKQYENLQERTKKYFYEDKRYNWVRYYPNFPNYYLVLKVKKNIHTHYKDKGGDLEKRRDYLRDLLFAADSPLFTNYSKCYPASRMRTQVRDQIQKFKKGEIEDISISKPFMDYIY